MLVSKINISLFRIKVFSKSFLACPFNHYHGRVNTVAKRGSILEEMIANKDKRNKWHFNIQTAKAKCRPFEKIHKPHRRRIVLNSLFVKNITDVISTGDINPELATLGIEITGVQMSPCCKMLNVFWQVPVSKYDDCEDIGKVLNAAGPKIRAELISRNVLGRVPFIFFLRDGTNAKIAEFEQAMKKLESQPKTDSSIIADDSFVNDIYSFKDSKADRTEIIEPDKNKTKEDPLIPQKPLDMKSDVFGLDHDIIMGKVLAFKKKRKTPLQHTAVICPEHLENEDDLFSKIPGVCFQADSSKETESREAILKRFHIERKMIIEQKKNQIRMDNCHHYEDYSEEEEDIQFNSFDNDDFIEDETRDS